MKKIFLFGFAAAAVLAGCSKDETIEVSRPGAITFDSFVNLSTKGVADDLVEGTFTSFKVWGLANSGETTIKPFNGTIVTKSASGWTYSPVEYWQNGYTYSFVAVAPSEDEGSAAGQWALTAPTEVGKYGSIAFNNGPGTTDLIYATDTSNGPVSTDEACPTAVNLTFNHLLSRVKFKFTNQMLDASVLNITNVTITNANTKGNVDLDNSASWSLAVDNTTSNLNFGGVLLEEDETEGFVSNVSRETDHLYMIPLKGADAYILTFTVQRNYHGGLSKDYEHTVTLPAVEWAAGNSYCFTAEINEKNINPNPDDPSEFCPIEFTASVDKWGDFNEEGLPGYTIGGEGA